MKYLPLLAVLTFGSFTNLAFAQRAPVGFSSESAKNAAQTILSRIYEVSGGVDNIAAIREGKTTVVGYYNMKGAIVYLDAEMNGSDRRDINRVHGVNVLPFEIELRSDGTRVIRVAGFNYNGEGDGESPIRKVRVMEYTFDDRNPQITVSEAKFFSMELAVSVLSSQNGSWLGPVADVSAGIDLTSYNLQGTNFTRPYPGIEKLTASTGFVRALIGVGFSQKVGSLNLKGKVGYQIFVSAPDDNYVNVKEAENGSLTEMAVNARRSSLNSELSLTKNVGKTRIGIFYEGQYYRTDRVKGFDGNSINVAPLGVQTPHRAGIRVNF